MTTEDPADWSRIYRALAHDDRRELLRYLGRVPETRVADVEQRLLDRADDPAEAEISSLRIMLHHVHVPHLAEAGLLTWDSEEDRVRLTALGSQLSSELVSPGSAGVPTTDDREPAVE